MRTLFKLILTLAVALLLSAPALAAKGANGNGNANGHDKSDSSSSNNGGGNGNGNNGNGNGNGGSNNSNNGNGNGNANGAAAGADSAAGSVSSDAIIAVPDDQQVVENAVRARAALSLEQITTVVGSDTDGRILDVQLVTFKGIYLYDVTVLEQNGVLHKLYYNARSGIRVRTD